MSWKHLYATSRDVRITQDQVNLGNVSMNGGYSTQFWNNGQFADFLEAGIVTLDMPIGNEAYTGKIPKIGRDEQPTGEFVPKLTRFVRLEYSDLFTNADDLTASIEKTGGITGVQVFATPEEARIWVRSNTNLVEDEGKTGTFLISEAGKGITGEDVPAKYLIIE